MGDIKKNGKKPKEENEELKFKDVDDKKVEKSKEIMKDKEEEKKENKKSEIMAISGGMLVGKTLEEQYRLAKCFVISKMVPKAFDTPEKVLTAMQYSYELGLKPLSAMRQIAIINGIPSLYGDLPLAMVESSGLLEDIEEYLFDKDYKKICLDNKNLETDYFGAYCKVKRKNRTAVERVFTVDDAVYAGLLNEKGGSIKDTWAKYPKVMLKYRARSMALKDSFPDVLSGVAITEYDYNNLGDADIKEIDEEKAALLAEINSLMLDCKAYPDINDARLMQLQNQYIKNEDIRFADKKDLVVFKNVLKELYEKTSVSEDETD